VQQEATARTRKAANGRRAKTLGQVGETCKEEEGTMTLRVSSVTPQCQTNIRRKKEKGKDCKGVKGTINSVFPNDPSTQC